MTHAKDDEQLERRRKLRHESRTTQTYRRFISEVESALGADPKQAEQSASTIVCLLEQRLLGEEARDLNAQLPQKFVELLDRCDLHLGRPAVKYSAEDFVAQVSSELGLSIPAAEDATRKVFAVLSRHVSFGEIDDVVRELPREFRELWPQSVISRIVKEEEQERYLSERDHRFEPEPLQ